MLGERRCRSGKGDHDPRIEKISEREGAYFRSVQAAPIACPEDASEEDGNTSNKPTSSKNQSFYADHRKRRHPLLQFQLEGTACAIAGNCANGDERQKE